MSLRETAVQKVVSAPMIQVEVLGMDAIDTILLDEIPSISRCVPRVAQSVVSMSMIGLAWTYLWVDFPIAALIFSGALGCGTPMYFIERRNLREVGRRRAAILRRLYEALTTLSRGMKDLKINYRRKEYFLTEKLFPLSAGLKRETFLVDTINTFVISCGLALAFLVISTLIFFSDQLGLSDGFRPSVVILYLVAPLDSFLSSVGEVFEGSKSLGRIQEILAKLDAEPEGYAERGEIPAAFDEISFEDLTFRYQGEGGAAFALGPVSMSLKSGEVVFLTGGNGSGKTTLFKILCGLYSATSGAISVDGTRLKSGEIGFLRSNSTVIFDDDYLFQDIATPSREDDLERARDDIEILLTDGVVSVDNNQLSRVKLSKGQKKRVALLNAYVDNKKIFLFDEWAADQDPQYRRKFYKEILPELRRRGKAVIAITHDDEFFREADQVVEMRGGMICNIKRTTGALDRPKPSR
ncbi:MAG TPA: ATP-binding cassette domain-containing protein [Rhizomicrobium sp.]|nr:ATP-binding cassette domain-containing protein [Rhizomicrobium sp.]